MKTIVVKWETWEKLMKMRIDLKTTKSLDEVINILINNSKNNILMKRRENERNNN